ncbi:MAG: hypothetical protein J7621_21905 [Niastella sp.]|nr:hypothetical protein [Niastella sp.]
MKKVSMRKFSLLGLVLIGASAVTAAVIPSNKNKGTSGRLLVTNNGAVANQLTCSRDQATGALCTWTETKAGGGAFAGEFSRTSTSGKATSSITNAAGNKVKTITDSPGALNHTSFN